jgi:23S rRNA (cytosine1962-C5)-methyltransferase
VEARRGHRRERGAVVKKLLGEALAQRLARLPADTTCFRWIDGEIPDVTVDRFGPVAVLSLYAADEQDAISTGRSSRAESRDGVRLDSRTALDSARAERGAPTSRGLRSERELAEALAATAGIEAVYVKRRPREARKLANEAAAELAPPLPLIGAAVDSLTVTELGARFEIRPGNGLSVGLYLDARDARAWVRANAKGRTVLNTFAYTCGFSVAARLGGATRAVNVDASRKVLDWGERNHALNELTVDRHDFVSGDTFDWLARFAKKGETFDLVILDPPGFATTKTSRFTAERDYHRLVAAAEQVIAPQGLLLAMCNVEQTARAFEDQLQRGLTGREAREVTRFGASAIDFSQAALRCHVLELGPRPARPARRTAPR